MCSSSQTDHTLHLDMQEAQKKKEQIELQMKRKAEVQQQLAGGGVEPSAKSARCTKNSSSSFMNCSIFDQPCFPHFVNLGGTSRVLLANMAVERAIIRCRTSRR